MLKYGQVAMKICDHIVPLLESQVCIDVSGSIREKRQLRLSHIRVSLVSNDDFFGEDQMGSLTAAPLARPAKLGDSCGGRGKRVSFSNSQRAGKRNRENLL